MSQNILHRNMWQHVKFFADVLGLESVFVFMCMLSFTNVHLWYNINKISYEKENIKPYAFIFRARFKCTVCVIKMYAVKYPMCILLRIHCLFDTHYICFIARIKKCICNLAMPGHQLFRFLKNNVCHKGQRNKLFNILSSKSLFCILLNASPNS